MTAYQRRTAQLDALYAELPTLECQGKCAESCGPIAMSRLEWERIRRTLGTTPKPEGLTCPLLHEERCTVYVVRPMLCRLWGLVDVMPCQWGCVPSRYLSRAEGYRFLARADEIGA